MSTAAKEASDLKESVRRDDTKESKAFEDLLSNKAAEKLEELSEEHNLMSACRLLRPCASLCVLVQSCAVSCN